jgi:hypothetical protein
LAKQSRRSRARGLGFRSPQKAEEIQWSRSNDQHPRPRARDTDRPIPNLSAIGSSASVAWSPLFWRSWSVTRQRLRLAKIHLNPTEC